MISRFALCLLFTLSLTGCVSTGDIDRMTTAEGRNEARDAYIQLGIGYLQQGTPERAKAPLKKALELDPSSADAHAALALVFQTEMENQLADKHYRQALSARSDARILNNYGSFLYEQGRYQEALERFGQAAADTLYSERSRVFENMGLTALRLGDTEQARDYFLRSLRLNARQPSTLLELAVLAFDSKQYVPAREYYQRFSDLSAQNARSLLLGSRLARIFDDRDRAASLGLQLKRLYPASSEYQQFVSEQR